MRHAARLMIGVVVTSQALVPAAGWALEPNERISEVVALEHAFGRVKALGSGALSTEVQRVRGGLEFRRLFSTPIFVEGAARMDRERREPYDLQQWGGELGVGWALSETADVLAKYRLDHYKVYNVSSNSDPDFRTVALRSDVTALGLSLRHDRRDNKWYPTRGSRVVESGELAMRALGGDFTFGRLETDLGWYATPWESRRNDPFLGDVTFVEHFHAGWVIPYGHTDRVPFFERYFVGGASTVRGHRTRWLTPRGLEQQFVGGELELINTVEARAPIFQDLFHRQLSAALFFDAGRSYHRFSEIGDFGYGVGVGLRYVVHLWKVSGVIRADEGFSLSHEGDDSAARFHLTFGVPF